jgi:hypothetical protein
LEGKYCSFGWSCWWYYYITWDKNENLFINFFFSILILIHVSSFNGNSWTYDGYMVITDSLSLIFINFFSSWINNFLPFSHDIWWRLTKQVFQCFFFISSFEITEIMTPDLTWSFFLNFQSLLNLYEIIIFFFFWSYFHLIFDLRRKRSQGNERRDCEKEIKGIQTQRNTQNKEIYIDIKLYS